MVNKHTYIVVDALLIIAFLYTQVKCEYVYANEKMYVGIWEASGIRVAFEKNEKWKSRRGEAKTIKILNSIRSNFDMPSKWHVFFDGNNYGSIETINLDSYNSFSQIGVQKIKGVIPDYKFRKKSKDFPTFAEDTNPRPVLVTFPNKVGDPEKWKPGKMQNNIVENAKEIIAIELNKFIKFEDKNKKIVKDDFKILKGYVSNNNKSLIQLVYNNSKTGGYCVYFENEKDCNENEPRWFYVNNGIVELIGHASNLIDAADLDSDNYSEFVFSIVRYSEDGYALYSPTEKTWTEFVWSYH